MSTEKSIESSTSLFSFIIAPLFPLLYHKFICLSNDASPAAIWCFSLRSKWCCSTSFREWCDVCPQCAVRHTSLGVAVIIGGANIICRRQTSFKKPNLSGRQIRLFCWLGHRDSEPFHKSASGFGVGVQINQYSSQKERATLSCCSFFLAGAQGFEPRKWRSQSPLPYRLAMPQNIPLILTTYVLYQKEIGLSIAFSKIF